MKIGVCAPIEYLPLVESVGYDYIESHFRWIAKLDEAEFVEKSEWVKSHRISPEVWNVFFPDGIKLYAPDGNQEEILANIAAFAEVGFARASAWGGKEAIIGSGYVRGIPEGMTREQTEAQFARILAVCGEIAQKYGMRVAVEPLSRNECNYIHTVAEGMAVAELSGHPAVGTMVDFYHHNNNGDDLTALPGFADKLYHAHYGRPGDHSQPMAEDVPQLEHLAKLLPLCPQIQRISLECAWKPSFEAGIREARPLMEIFKNI